MLGFSSSMISAAFTFISSRSGSTSCMKLSNFSSISFPESGMILALGFSCCTEASRIGSRIGSIRSTLFIPRISASIICLMANSFTSFIRCLKRLPSIKVTRGAILTSSPRFISSTSFLMRLGKAIPVGSIIRISGLYSFARRVIVVLRPTLREQQMQPLVISLVSNPNLLITSPSIPISPISFTMMATFFPFSARYLPILIIVVVFPLPRKPPTTIICIYFPPFSAIIMFPCSYRTKYKTSLPLARLMCVNFSILKVYFSISKLESVKTVCDKREY